MHNPVPATPTRRSGTRPRRDQRTLVGAWPGSRRCSPARSQLAITTVTDELGRPLVGVFVPDGELL